MEDFKLQIGNGITHQRLICSSCGYIGIPNKVNKGSGAVEIILWLLFLFPGLIYSVWRRSAKPNVCPSCGNKTLIPLDSPVGKELAGKQGKTIEQANAVAAQSVEKWKNDRVRLIVIAIAVVVVIYITSHL